MSASDVLVLAEIQREALADITHELLTAARSMAAATGGEAVVVALAPDGSRFAPALGAADRIVLVDDPRLAAYAPGPYLAALEAVVAAERPRAVLIGATSIGWDLAPMLAARLDAPLVTGCKEIRVEGGALGVTASFCGGKMMAEARVAQSPAVLMVLPGSFRPATESGKAVVERRTSPVPLEAGPVRFEEFILPEAGDVDITQQDILVAVGRGIQQKDNLELAEELARTLGGAVCASRPVVDQGWLPPTRQVGKSGMTVKPKLYLAFGISGAPEHQEGMKASDLIIAVNTDPRAPIFDVAHYGAQIDALELLPALVEAVQARKG
ncbi:MAG: electron transfer flavoprotein subunit alpha/FixB family protein [Thermoguttaceae bacterium]|jgi:electron transfer flavoprotein alpha subunit|nr:electron transfer flavoprotein subunit alpha/FixB family protein [Thermoguttaceae bacterium]